jgi:hypothetical protein
VVKGVYESTGSRSSCDNSSLAGVVRVLFVVLVPFEVLCFAWVPFVILSSRRIVLYQEGTWCRCAVAVFMIYCCLRAKNKIEIVGLCRRRRSAFLARIFSNFTFVISRC